MPAKKKTVNDEFDVGVTDDDLAKVASAKVEDIPAPKKAAPKKAAKKALDPEDDRDNWPTIHIEMEENRPNYEYLASHGTKKDGTAFGHELQVMRGVDVKVPPSIVYMLRDAVAAHYVQRRDPVSNKMTMIRQDRSSIPWRLINGGKYC
jgi:hypothetical protein